MNRLKELREEKGLSIHACAKAAGLTPSTLLRAEKGERKISTAQAVALSKFFGVTIEYLLGEETSSQGNAQGGEQVPAQPNRLRELRKERGLTSNQLADILGLGGSSLRCIERAARGFSVESLIRTCDFFGVSIDYMLCRDEFCVFVPQEVKNLVAALYHILFPGEAEAEDVGELDIDEVAIDEADIEEADIEEAAAVKAESSAPKTCSNRLRELRKERDLSLRGLADKVGIGYSTLAYIERAEHGFSIESLLAVCDFFGVSTDYMLCRTEERK